MSKIKKIAIFTGNRAEYGLLVPIIRSLSDEDKLDVKLIVSGAHLDNSFGKTVEEIKKDGFKISSKVNINFKKNISNSTSLAISDGVKKISNTLIKIKPDIFIVYADRFEGFAAVIASTQMNVVTAHIEGGDLTQGGALDDSVRHAMTKLSHIHFASNREAKKRIIKLGEEPWRVFNVGFAALDLLKKNNVANEFDIKNKLNIDLSLPIILFTQHSVTTRYEESKKQMEESIKALIKAAKKNINVIVTYPNNDLGSFDILKIIKSKKFKHKNIKILSSLGRFYYHGILNLNKLKIQKVVCVGNSSSGIKETPYFNCPTVNIGLRQNGRLRANNVIDVPHKEKRIYSAILKSIYDIKYLKKIKNIKNPYDGGNTGKKILKIFKDIKYNKNKLLNKKMTY